ncbi:MAG: hydantoinase/oxoprolinase family protein [Syntrophales bacterium]|nr:hydantoinase/oxoprolinase family protein [Syntrophales bacterium]
MGRYIVYIDNGGTFTDAVIVKGDGSFVSGKADTTPGRFQDCFFKSIENAAQRMNKSLKEVLSNTDAVGYGTTIGTNIIVSGVGGPKLGFIATKGQEDRTIIQRRRTAGLTLGEGMHRAGGDKASPIIPRSRIKGVSERIDCMGEVVIPLAENEVRKAIQELCDEEVEGIAVGFTWAFLNGVHERRVKEIIEEMAPRLPISISSEVSPVIREYPRYMSTIIDLHIGQALKKLLQDIKESLQKYGYTRPLLIMQAAGGLARSEVAKPATTLHSGPVGGLTGVEFLKELYGFKNAMGSDVGGTSFDVSVSSEMGEEYIREPIVGRFEIANPMREISIIGAGGGTIAWIDHATKGMRAGPQSAGAVPGPVCYDAGGTEPTVADADVALNRIDANYFLGGKVKLNRSKALAAIKEKIAEPLGMDIYGAAEGISKIVDGNMNSLLRTIIASKGIDPSKYVMFAFGGAGGAHCAGYTSGLGFSKVIISPYAAVFSAFGASTADIRHRYEASPFILISNIPYEITTLRFNLDEMKSLDEIPGWVVERFNRMFEDLEQKVDTDMKTEGFKKEDVSKRYEILARYGGQLWEIRCPIKVNRISSIEDLRGVIQDFEEEYLKVYTREAMVPRGGVEIVSIAIVASAPTLKPILVKRDWVGPDAKAALKGERDVYFDGKWERTSIYEMESLKVGNLIEGPAIVEGVDTTVVIPKDRKITMDEYLNLIMEERG